ncbi:MAG: tRNA (adenosine(37)-N6)-threonylcarbamoyltransferase complex ATPase subunit type 1 TsaE [Deltaproteobacteria bacterium]|nr:tRNA (adenosine(37)-N6)-threonylcarbamoyltransferase complex ATPase subunit type 1 TsaE [Deltaproteobacteria bacterium]
MEPEDTLEAGRLLAIYLDKKAYFSHNVTVLLQGPMGCGKTVLAKGFGKALGIDPDDIVSPTFSIANRHRGRRVFTHLDLFRLGETCHPLDEFVNSGLDEYFDGVSLIEWSERLDYDYYPEPKLRISMKVFDSPSSTTHTPRLASFEGRFPYSLEEVFNVFPRP